MKPRFYQHMMLTPDTNTARYFVLDRDSDECASRAPQFEQQADAEAFAAQLNAMMQPAAITIAVIFHKHMSGHSYTVARLVECPDGITRAIEFRVQDFAYSPARLGNKKDAFIVAAARAAELGGRVRPDILVEDIGSIAIAVIPKAEQQARQAAHEAEREARIAAARNAFVARSEP